MSGTTYVNNSAGLLEGWNTIQNDPNSEGAKYWLERMGGDVTKESFGNAHAKETSELISGEYQKEHGSGSTEITAGTETDFAKEYRPQLQKANVEAPEVKERENDEKANKVSSGAGVGTPGAETSSQTILGSDELKAATDAAIANARIYRGDYQSLHNIWKAAETRRASLAGDPNAQELQSAIMRAAGDEIRIIQGEEMGLLGPKPKGMGTPWIGPGVRLAMDPNTGKPAVDKQGRYIYDVDPAAYTGRFIEPFTPTQDQIKHWNTLFPESKFDITTGYLNPWQQVNIQWMTGNTSDKLGLLDQQGIEPTVENLGLFEDNLKEGIIPEAWRENWRTEQWGDIKDPNTGLWTPATDPAVREQAVQKQLVRYEEGQFNPTTGKGGAAAGSPSQWGEGTGLISPLDSPPSWWTGGDTPDYPGHGVTGSTFGPFAGPGLLNSSKEILTTPYTRPELQDWSHLMPEEGLLRSQAQRSVVANQGANFQPWAQGGLIEYSPSGTSTYIPPTYTPTPPPPVINDPIINPPIVSLEEWQQPGWDYRQYKDPSFDNPKPEYKATGWDSSLDWYKGLLTPSQQLEGFKNISSGNPAGNLSGY